MASKKLPETMFVWWLGDPAHPQRIGQVDLLHSGRHGPASFTYDPHWQDEGFPLCPSLPLDGPVFTPEYPMVLPGAIADAMPDRWGQNMILYLDHPARAAAIDYLYYAGDCRFGALGISLSASSYEPCKVKPLIDAASLEEANAIIQRIVSKEPANEKERLLVESAKAMGGAQPKMLVHHDGREWLAKFPRGDFVDLPMIEHATMRLARAAGIRSADTATITAEPGSHVVLVDRFDREPDGRRRHCISARTLIGDRDPHLAYSYRRMADALRRHSHPDRMVADGQELFRRMVFNILTDNTDDHETNHAFMLDEASRTWSLAPAYDLVPQFSGLCCQAMMVGDAGNESTRKNALSDTEAFFLSRRDAEAEYDRVATAVSEWRAAFSGSGVIDYDLDALTEYLDSEEKLRERETSASRPSP